jgi:predicted acyl esterase
MRIDWDVPIEMDDGLVLKADIFRPIGEGKYPVIITYGPYGKGLSFQEGYSGQWQKMIAGHADVAYGSTNKYQNWETVDPEKWIPDGYVCIRVDSRGCGRSPGFVNHFSARETRDLYLCIEWAGTQPWSNGKVGLNGVSYYAMNQWQVASLNPPHLAAICPWEGAADWYRDATHHGGILSTFWTHWYDMQIKTVQYGLGERGSRNQVTGRLVSGDLNMSDRELTGNRTSLGDDILAHPLDDEYHRERSPQWDSIRVPILSSANWGGQGLHLRGNVEGFVRAASQHKWLEIHGLEHWTHFYTDYGVNLQKRFFGYFLKGENNGWDQQPPVQLQIRHVDGTFAQRSENEWPIARTKWVKYFLHPSGFRLADEPAERKDSVEFDAPGDGVTFLSEPFSEDTEITGPAAAKLFVSSDTADADIFVVLRLFTPDLREVTFNGAIDPNMPLTMGWLRASHRKLNLQLSKPYRPFHTHDEIYPLVPEEVVELDIELWPTCIVVPRGYRIAFSVRGKDYIYLTKTGIRLPSFKNELRGCGPFLHDEPRDRLSGVFDGKTTLHVDSVRQPYLLVPVIPCR